MATGQAQIMETWGKTNNINRPFTVSPPNISDRVSDCLVTENYVTPSDHFDLRALYTLLNVCGATEVPHCSTFKTTPPNVCIFRVDFTPCHQFYRKRLVTLILWSTGEKVSVNGQVHPMGLIVGDTIW